MDRNSTSANDKSIYTEREISRLMGQVTPQIVEWVKKAETHEEVAMGTKTSRSNYEMRKFIEDHEERIEGMTNHMESSSRYNERETCDIWVMKDNYQDVPCESMCSLIPCSRSCLAHDTPACVDKTDSVGCRVFKMTRET